MSNETETRFHFLHSPPLNWQKSYHPTRLFECKVCKRSARIWQKTPTEKNIIYKMKWNKISSLFFHHNDIFYYFIPCCIGRFFSDLKFLRSWSTCKQFFVMMILKKFSIECECCLGFTGKRIRFCKILWSFLCDL